MQPLSQTESEISLNVSHLTQIKRGGGEGERNCFMVPPPPVQLSCCCWRCIWIYLQGPQRKARGCLMSPPSLESQGCHLIPLCYLFSCSSALSCYPILSFPASWSFLLNNFRKILQYFSLRDRLFCMTPF